MEQAWLEELREFIAIPSVSADPAHQDDLRRAGEWVRDYVKRLGHEAAAVKIQDAFLAGRRDEAAAAVPDALIDETALVGPPERIKDRVQAWKAASKRIAKPTPREVWSTLMRQRTP